MRRNLLYEKRIFDKNFRFLFKLLAMKKSFPHLVTKNFIQVKSHLKYIISNDINIYRAHLNTLFLYNLVITYHLNII